MSRRPPDVLRAWRDSIVPVEDEGVARARRERVIGSISRSIRAAAEDRRRERLRRRWIGAAAAAAALAASVGLGWNLLRTGPQSPTPTAVASAAGTMLTQAGTVVVVRGDGTVVAAPDDPLGLRSGDELKTTGGSSARFELVSGPRVAVAESTTLGVVSNHALRLASGAVDVQVPPLVSPSTFSVVTPDAKIVVHGTEFRVRVSGTTQSTVTEVSVSEGVVSIVHDDGTTTVEAGGSWSSAQEVGATPPPEPATTAEPAASIPSAPRQPPTTGGAAAPPTKTAALAEQNRLFQSAAAARDRGDDETAARQWGALLARYPRSPLAPEARVERFRALKRLGKKREAAAEARRYLRDNRDGAARNEARDVALEPPKLKRP